ncbi:apoptotic chromatin condensation inducer in the nucleus isoform X1 [Leptidea sinapis]|uniref:apoptotic chromatin condensation inducer in the nucleus isoform X1 n=1 Tax=Leptidea sinapis TaxID=189913 RepID=UPI0021C39388|nr:apoptotic chromatin condensation inducer in the nucleus isoform X1 [Leptidea sinapis]XP_050675460.1 apoptotic chromatin condensation inducer in the nucleus isoform X1 [Leptidea sinapis]
MRRKSEKAPVKKTKGSPEKKEKEKTVKLKRTRSSRRRKQSSSSENESDEESVPQQETEVISSEPVPVQGIPVEESPEMSQDQVWHVKTPENTGDGGKLKICLTRPPSTPERVDRSPRSKRKHSRATSTSDTAIVDGDEKKKLKHRTRRTTVETKDISDRNSTEQDDSMEKEAETEVSYKPESDIKDDFKESIPDDTPMSTTSDDDLKQIDKAEVVEDAVSKSETGTAIIKSLEGDLIDKTSDADTTVKTPLRNEDESSTQTTLSPLPDNSCSARKEERSVSVEKSEVLELHVEDESMKLETSNCNKAQAEDSMEVKDPTEVAVSEEDSKQVSINEDKNEISGISESVDGEATSLTKNDVVEDSIQPVEAEQRKSSVEKNITAEEIEQSNKDAINTCTKSNKDISTESSIGSEVKNTVTEVSNENSTGIVISRKRRWGSRPNKLTTQKSITISTEVLKEIIPDVKPVEFEEVIEEKKHKRVEVPNKVEKPVLPKIIIDNSENVALNKRESLDKDTENVKCRDIQPTTVRKISIVNDSDNITARPPSPPRHKQSNILFITHLVRPFTLLQLKNLLQRTGRIIDNGFWIDKIKSKCFVIYENEDQAVETRHALHGVTWPVSNPKTLHVDFSTQEEFDKAKANEDTDNAKVQTIPGTVEDWLREQDMKREKGELERPWERKMAMREWDVGKNDKVKEKDKYPKDERTPEKRRHRTPERSPEPARKFKKKEEEAPAKLLDDLFRKTKTTPCIYWLPLSAETIAVKEEQRRQHMAEYERRMQENRRPHRRH